MKLNCLLKDVEYKKIHGRTNIDMQGIAYDSRKIHGGDIFVAIDGIDQDGHRYIPKAIENGASCIILSREYETVKKTYPDITVILVDDPRHALTQLSVNYFDHPAEKIKIMGITGTKGKSTISYMIRQIFVEQGLSCSVSGTLGMVIKDRHIETSNTTPSSYDLMSFFKETADEGLKHSVIEVSSIALKLNRVEGITFDIGMFTNLSQAHITDREHPSFEDYYASKCLIFNRSRKLLVNTDDEYVKKGINEYINSNDHKKLQNEIYTIGLNDNADITARNIHYNNDSCTFDYTGFGKIIPIELDLPGMFNIYNSLFAVSACLMYNISSEAIQKGLKKVKVKGRCEMVETGKDFSIMIDYAHTPDSLMKLLQAIRGTKTKGSIICLFGCGGDRDHMMRPMMGEIAGMNADFSIITSDNSRSEEPSEIIRMIEEGIKKIDGKYICIKDRTEAIRYAMKTAKKDDIVILAGKGQETYMEVKGIKTHYDEREEVARILKEFK
jgi:UDP-N-acetylmuramoyl-L-alanyl-D-glutamate--2,6-diaminopimelate ligase